MIRAINQDTVRAIAFPVLDLWFALPIESILKIIPCPPINSPIKDSLGIVEWSGQTVTVIDLTQKVKTEYLPTTNNQEKAHRSLILIQTNSAELCGFVSEEYPSLIDIPLNTIRSIPSSYRQVSELGVISQMAILPQQESADNFQILLLGKWTN